MSFRRIMISGFLYGAKGVGLFKAARTFTKNHLRILCYHGVALKDEHQWRPPLYLTESTFQKRLDYLARAGYPVLALDTAIKKREFGLLPKGATVITFDDGFKDFHRLAFPALAKRGLPATLYVTSYHAVKQTPVFRLMVSYMAWASSVSTLDLCQITSLPHRFFVEQSREIDLKNAQADDFWWGLVRFAEEHLSEEERVALCRELGRALDIDYDALCDLGLFGIVDEPEVKELSENGISIQLHTHRHVLPETASGMRREIEDNRNFLEPLAGPQSHFCFPSGIWSERQLPVLDLLGIDSATTCDIGMNSPSQHRLALRRFLDGEQVTQIRFEAEMSGLMDLIRNAGNALSAMKQRVARIMRRKQRSTGIRPLSFPANKGVS